MASRLSQRWFALLAVLFTGRIAAGRRIRIDDSTPAKTVLLSFGRPERTNYTLGFSPSSRFLQTLLNIDPDTGVVTLIRRLKCGHPYNRTRMVTVRCISTGVPALLFLSPVVVLLNNRRCCVERWANSPSDTTLTTGRLIHSIIGTTNMNKNRILLERKQLNGFRSSSEVLPRRLFGRNRSKVKEYARTFRYLFGGTSPVVMDSPRFHKGLGMNFNAFDEARLRIRRSTRNNPPKFAKPLERGCSVREDVKVGTVVYTVSASDPDRHSRGKVDYKIAAIGNINSENFFKVNASTGKIWTVKELDREAMANHKFRVTATDGGTPPLSADMTLTIEVLDVNDHSPVFDQKVYGKNISESVDRGSTVLAVRAHDSDIGLNKEIHYSIVNNTWVNNVFSIGRDSGIISVEQGLDREQVASYRLLVKAEDQGKPARSSTAEVYITLIDDNDCIPVFNESIYDFIIPEDSQPGTFVGATNATDCDTGVNKKIKYSITSGNQDRAFRISSSSGIIRVQGPLDFEQDMFYELQVTAEDSGEIQLDNMVSVKITVKDVNDCFPEFLKPNGYRFKVMEDVGVDYQLGSVYAQDRDDGKNGEIIYSLQDGKIPFKVESFSGKLKTKEKLDREKVPAYNFQVIAKDKGNPPLNSTVTVFITIEDVNDSPPYFTEAKYNATIAEDFSSSKVFLTVLAKDLDEGGSIMYSVNNVPDDCFSINQYSGGLRRSRTCRLSFKIKRKYVFQVEASDGKQRSSAKVVVMISDANDHDPTFTKSTFYASVYENQPAGTSVLQVDASDDDFGENARLSYSIKGRKAFKINSTTGVISSLVPLDRESTRNYRLLVIATDHGRRQKSGRAWVRITVNDLNDNAPKFDHVMYNVSLKENVHVGTLVHKLEAKDEDVGKNKKITYSLDKSGNEGDMFKINPDLGDITVNKELDREKTSQYILTVVATDHGNPSQKSTTQVKVSLIDVIDSPPSFASTHYIVNIPEDFPLKREVIRVKATTKDTMHHSQIQYNLGSDYYDKKFIIYRMTGSIELDKPLDFETKTTYLLTVRAVYASFLATAIVRINVIDVNDMEPVLAPRFDIIINMQAGMFPHGIRYKIPAYDPDVSSRLSYEITNLKYNIVAVEKDTGVLNLKESALISTGGVQFDVRVSDGRFQKFSRGSIHLNIITEILLNASVTVYLKNATTSQFFRSFRKFKKSIGSVLGVAEDNVVIFYVVNKTRSQWIYDKEADDDFLLIDNYLTVWMAVRQPASKEAYLQEKFIQDKLFLNVKTLERETGMIFLPSDEEIIQGKSSNHYLYVNEPCAEENSFFTCFTKKSFQATPNSVLNTPTVLFRSLKIKEVVRRGCPCGFYGSMCNFKLDSCYSSPCKNNGECIDSECGYICKCPSNFVGKDCLIDTRKSKCSTLPENICLNKGECHDLPKGGFVCKCPSADHDPSRLCHASARSFQNGSFAAFPGLTQKWHIEVSLEFATIQPNGLLMYIGRYDHKHDFMALEIRNQRLYHIFSAGGEVETISVGSEESITSGRWNKVTISYQNQTGSLVLGHKCDSAVAVKFGKQVGNFSCAAAKRLRGRFRSMDLTSPLLLGGLPFHPGNHSIEGKSLDGCIRNVLVNQEPLNLGSPIVERNSLVGCPAKRDFCSKNTCVNNGKCVSLWKSAICQCPEGFAGKTCEINTMPMDFTLRSFLISTLQNVVIKLPWSMSLLFRTVERTGSLMEVLFSSYGSLLQLRDGALHYSYHTFNMSFSNVELHNGNWHHVEVTWTVTSVRMTVDHVHDLEVKYQEVVLDGRTLVQVTLGDSKKSGNGFSGCVKGVMVGGALLNTKSATKNLISDGCSSKATCRNKVCPKGSVCRESWRKTSCVCQNGFVGESCVDVCTLRPCQNGAMCKRMDDAVGFKCSCPDKYLGQYCEIRSQLPCRDEFYSSSGLGVCGPCNCDTSLGYNPVCNKTTGYCRCQNLHYREILAQGRLGDICLRCVCDRDGSKNQMCESIGGQCPCLPGVIGRKCDMCRVKQGEITRNGKGCKIINTSCPRAKAEDIEWPRKKFGTMSQRKCPFGAQGHAYRLCAKYVGWEQPNVSNCVTSSLLELMKMLRNFGNLTRKMAIKVSHNFGNSLFAQKEKDFYPKDVVIAYNIIVALLDFESRQQEEDLASSQDKKFLDTVLKGVSTLLDKKYTGAWSLIKGDSHPAVSLMRLLEEFGIGLASNIIYIRRNEHRGKRSTSSLQSLNMVEPNLLMQLEPVSPRQFHGLLFPLEEHKQSLLVSIEWQNRTNRVYIPTSLFKNSDAPRQESAIVFIALKDLGDLLPSSFDIKESITELSPDVNSDVIIIGIKGMESTYLKEPITIEFQNHEVNRSQYDCVFWNYSAPGRYGGAWSKNGCTKAQSNFTHTICQCHHLTSFAVVSDLKIEVPVVSPYSVQIITYVGISVSLVILLVALLSFTCLSGLTSNTNSIHKNLVLAIVIAELVYLMGINRTTKMLLCRFVAIVLHFFFDAVFAWMFVEVVHMYRRLIEKRNIDSGQMTFYYFLGWGCPAIVVGLSTGMAVEDYGNDKFCWMTTDGTLIWTFAIPIFAVLILNSIVFMMALRLSIKKSKRKRKQASYNPKNVPVTSVYKNALNIKNALIVAAAFLPVLLITLVFAVLAINKDLLIFHYLFAFLCCCQSLFVVLFYVAFDPKVREEYKNAFIRWKTGDKNYGRPRRRRLYEMSYHPGSNLAGEDGYGMKRMNAETTSTDRSTSTLHSISLTRTDAVSTFPDDDSDSDVKEIKKRKPRKEDPIDMQTAIKMWNAPEKSEVSTTQPESSESSEEGRRRATMVISSESGSSGDGSWEKKAKSDNDKQKGTAPLYASDGPMHSTPLELEQEKVRLLKKSPPGTPVAAVEPLPRSRLPSILKNGSSPPSQETPHGPEVKIQPSPQTLYKTVVTPIATKTGSDASSGSLLSSHSDEDMVMQAKLLSQSTEGGMSTASSKDRKRRSRKSRDIEHGKKSRSHRVHFHRTNADGSTKVRVKAIHLGEGKPRAEHNV